MPNETPPDVVPYSPSGFRQLGINPAPSPATLGRWRLKGVRGIRISTFLRGGRRYVTREAVKHFFDAVTSAADGAMVATHDRHETDQVSSRQDETGLDAVEQELEQEGL